MIQINLIPDVKQELINAQRVRTSVVSIAIFCAIAAVGAVVLMVIWVFGVQLTRDVLLDRKINDTSAEIAKVQDLSNTLTIQNQLEALPGLHDSMHMDSRVFSMLTTINPPSPNEINVTSFKLDTLEKTMTIEAQARNAYPALEAFRKTIQATQIEFSQDGVKDKVLLASALNDSERSYGEDANGNRVLRFKLSFAYADQLLSSKSKGLTIIAPTKSNVTDSFLGVPKSLFTNKAIDTKEGTE